MTGTISAEPDPVSSVAAIGVHVRDATRDRANPRASLARPPAIRRIACLLTPDDILVSVWATAHGKGAIWRATVNRRTAVMTGPARSSSAGATLDACAEAPGLIVDLIASIAARGEQRD